MGLIGRWRLAVVTATLLLWVFPLGLVSQALWRWLEAPWQRRSAFEAPEADAIVVLSDGHHPAPGPARLIEWHDPDRFLAGLDLYRAGKALLLMFIVGVTPFALVSHRKASAISWKRSFLAFHMRLWSVVPLRCSTLQKRLWQFVDCCHPINFNCC